MPTVKNTASIASLSATERKALAKAVVAARAAKQPWDGENGIVNDDRFPLIKSAIVGRKLVREAGKGEIIAKSYNREDKGLTGPRTADAKKATPAAKPAAKKAPAKRTRKATPKS